MERRKSYFLISVSNKTNLDLCIKYALAGFTNSINGLWTFLDIKEGDYISFLYGAKARNLYVVESKEAIKDAESAPPWPSVTFKQSGRTYYFPFRLNLKPVRQFEESLVRVEFNYVAENLLLRGGYRRTHFQADQTTLQAVSQMGSLWNQQIDQLLLDKKTFVPKFTRKRDKVSIPDVLQFQELILQAIIREYLSNRNRLKELLDICEVDVSSDELEVLGEKALPEGFVDILIKEAIPTGISRKIIIEVKTGDAHKKDLEQLKKYIDEIGEECIGGILIARSFPKTLIQKDQNDQTKLASYNFGELTEMATPITFQELLNAFRLTKM
ncbi:MAG: hypothetical protein ACYS91_17170 [Planctomycetota bacterium]|jgi:hypothetical protein